MSHSTMSLPAMYEFAKDVQNIDIFEGLTVPADIDRDTLIEWILHRSAPFEVTYPDATYMRFAVGTWSKVHQKTFQKWVDALNIKYDPLNNYDRTEESTDTGMEARSRGKKNDSSAISSNTDQTNTDSDVTNQVAPYDSASWNNSDKSTTGTTTSTNGSSLQSLQAGEKEQENALDSRSHKLRAFGNIGVTTSQQMLQSELDVDAWNLYEHITDLFLDEFCVLLY